MTITALNTLTSSNVTNSWNYSNQFGVKHGGSLTTLSERHQRDGSKNSLFRHYVGKVPPLAYTGDHKQLLHVSFCNFSLKQAVGTYWESGLDPLNLLANIHSSDVRPVSDSEKTAIKNSAISNANSSVKGQHYSAFETLFEGKKTVNMILNTVSTLVKGVRQVRRGKFAAAATTLGLKRPPPGVSHKNSLTDNWLAYRYGWIPLYSTVYGEMKRQYDLQKTKQPEYSVTGFSSNTFTGSTTGTWVDASGSGGDLLSLQAQLKIVGSHVRSVNVGYTYRITNETLSNTTSLGILNPALLAWEAVPLSFVADWFVNVSDVLDTFDTWNGKVFIHGFITETDRYSEKRTVNLQPKANMVFTASKPGTCSSRTVHMTRTVISSPPSVTLQLQHNLNINRLADGISLLKQLFR